MSEARPNRRRRRSKPSDGPDILVVKLGLPAQLARDLRSYAAYQGLRPARVVEDALLDGPLKGFVVFSRTRPGPRLAEPSQQPRAGEGDGFDAAEGGRPAA